MITRALSLAVVALVVAGCGGGDGDKAAERSGGVVGASEKFALPSLVSNGTSPIKLRTRAQVRFFNRTLPCGAKVMDAEVAPHRFMIVTFTLTERPGKGSCGTGAGQTARTAFRVRDGLITDWLRVPDEDRQPSDAQAA